MRLIDADAFAEFLQEAIKQQKYEDLKIDGLLTVSDVIEAVISELEGTSIVGFKNTPTVEPDWVSVTDRSHPDKEGTYLITEEAGGVVSVDCDHFIFCDDGTPYWLYSQNVTAWMPMPEPYRSEEI